MTPIATIGIPLHRSLPFVDVVSANIDAIDRHDVEILVSDRTGVDDAIDVLAARHAADPRVVVVRATDGADWVAHCNALLRRARGDTFCWMPHDDEFPPNWLPTLLGRLEAEPDVLMAFGRIEAVEADGTATDFTLRHPRADVTDRFLSTSTALDLLASAGVPFRGLFRRAQVVDRALYIPRTRDLVHADRAWVFSVALLGPMLFVPDVTCRKRYSADSTHAQWSAAKQSHRLALGATLGHAAVRHGGTPRRTVIALTSTAAFLARLYWTGARRRLDAIQDGRSRNAASMRSRASTVRSVWARCSYSSRTNHSRR